MSEFFIVADQFGVIVRAGQCQDGMAQHQAVFPGEHAFQTDKLITLPQNYAVDLQTGSITRKS